MLVQDYFTKEEIIETLQSARDYDVDDFYDLCEAICKRNHPIIGTHEASQALEAYKNDEDLDGYKTKDGAVGAAILVERYELDQFGSILTPLFNEPEKLANMVEYIRGKILFKDALNKASLDMFEATTEENLKKFIKATKEL